MKSIAYLAVMFTGCLMHCGAPAATPSQTDSWSTISFEMRSWGRTLSSWTVSSKGVGNWTRSSGGRPEEMVVHELAIGAEGYLRVASLVEKLPKPAPDSAKCENFMTDQPYGVVRMTKGATTTEIAWNAGCLDDSYIGFLNSLREANDLVESWGKKAKVVAPSQAQPN